MGLRVITFKVEEDLLEKIDLVVEKLGITRSDLIRTAIESFIKVYSVKEDASKKL